MICEKENEGCDGLISEKLMDDMVTRTWVLVLEGAACCPTYTSLWSKVLAGIGNTGHRQLWFVS